MMIPLSIPELEEKAKKIRRQVIEMLYQAGSGHPGGSLSVVEILVALFYGNILKFDPHSPKDEENDRFLLSCGHVCPAYYSLMADLGVFNESLLPTLRDLGSPLQGHPSRVWADFVAISSGSLGQGLGIGAGMALAMKRKESKNKVVVLCSDGELDEGSVWETVMFASHHQLDNLNLAVDRNGMQIGGETEEVLSLEPLVERFRVFGWEAVQVDGHDFRELVSAFCGFNERRRKPKVVICRTVRGKGVSFMEGEETYHSKTLTKEEYLKAMKELE